MVNFLGSLVGSFCSALLTSLAVGYYFIFFLQRRLAARVREDVPLGHTRKNGTPTMGGVYLLLVIILNTLIWCKYATRSVWMIIFTMVGFGCIGFIDDMLKICLNRGMSARHKFLGQWIIGITSMIIFIHGFGLSTMLAIPGYPAYQVDLSLLFYAWGAFIMVSASNAVNLTDGLDGLAIAAYLPSMFFFTIFFTLACASPLALPHLSCSDTSTLALFSAIIGGTCVGFIWYNGHPAQLFMGDVGALSLGAGLAALALFAKIELLLPMIALVFVAEVASVLLQVLVFRRTGHRIFRMAPLHHHFELCGVPETTIVVRAGIIATIACSFAACLLIYWAR